MIDLTDDERAAIERIADRDDWETQPVAEALLALDDEENRLG